MIKDLLSIADLPSNIALINSFPRFNIYQDYITPDPIQNEIFGFKYVYFKGGFPLSAFVSNPSSGDYLFQHFYSEYPTNLNDIYNSDIVSTEFGNSYTDALIPTYDYNIETKDLMIYSNFTNERYHSYVSSIMNSTSGITQTIKLNNMIPEKPISLEFIRSINNEFLINSELSKNNLQNVNLWNDKFTNSEETNIRFKIEYDKERMRLNGIKQLIDMCWDNLNLKDIDEDIYQLECDNPIFINAIKNLHCSYNAFTTLKQKQIKQIDNITYTLLLNNYIYFILKSNEVKNENGEVELVEDIYDYGVISLPEFGFNVCPVFNVTYPEAKLVYGISVKLNIL